MSLDNPGQIIIFQSNLFHRVVVKIKRCADYGALTNRLILV